MDESTAVGRRGFVLRVGAYGVDVGLAYGAFVLVQTLLFPVVLRRYEEAFRENGLLLEAYVFGTISLPVWLYFILSERSGWQATVGKRLFGLRVTTPSGGRATTGQVIGRTVGKLLPWELAHFAVNVPINPYLNPGVQLATWRLVVFGLVYLLLFVYLISVVRRPSQAVYDRIVGTAVRGSGD